MPAGSSPEAGFAGLWRFISVKPAPWAGKRAVTKTDAPLLEQAVEFAEGEVKGPARMACHGAKYSSGSTGLNEAFNGRIATDASGALGKSINLPSPPFTTFRLICGEKIRDFYFDDTSNLLMADDDIIYTLARPTGDPSQTKPGFSGPSFDCVKATATRGQLICADAGLSSVDRTLNKAYGALKKSLPAASFATFQSAQRGWLAYATKICGVDETDAEKNRVVECLNQQLSERADLLAGVKDARAGALTIEPRMKSRFRAEQRTEDSDILPLMSGGAPAEAFNAFIARKLKPDAWRSDDKERFALGDAVGEMLLHARRSFIVVRFDARIVSLQVSTDDYTGGMREARDTYALTYDLANRRAVTLEDVFGKNGDWRKFVANACKKQLHEQFSERGSPDPSDAEIRAAIVKDGSWLWNDDKATVIFNFFSIGGLPGGKFDVELPLKSLAPFMKAGAPVP